MIYGPSKISRTVQGFSDRPYVPSGNYRLSIIYGPSKIFRTVRSVRTVLIFSDRPKLMVRPEITDPPEYTDRPRFFGPSKILRTVQSVRTVLLVSDRLEIMDLWSVWDDQL